MLNIGIVGVGEISQKAYLPVMRSIGNVKWYMCTRNTEVLNRESKLFGRCIPCETIDELLQFPLDGVFIHVATDAHVEIARQFLEKGIPVYIDKPVADNYDETHQLYTLAKEHNTLLMAGFNRRFAPKVEILKSVENKKRIITEKNCPVESTDLRYRIFDIFIHPLDTALYLMDEKPTNGTYFYKKNAGIMEQCTVYLENDHETALVQFNATAGASLEKMEVQSPNGTYTLRNVTDLMITQGQDQLEDPFSTWDSTLYKRGFESMIHSFIIAIQTKGENPVSPESSLLSHLICERIVTAKSPQGFLSFDVNALG